MSLTHARAPSLSVVFTMNPPAEGLAGRSATSPALFNRCVLDWFGDWKEQSLVQVAVEFTKRLDVDRTDYRAPQNFKCGHLSPDAIPSYRDVLVSAFVSFHRLVAKTNQKLHEKYSRRVYLTPRHYLDFVAHFVKRRRGRVMNCFKPSPMLHPLGTQSMAKNVRTLKIGSGISISVLRS